MPTPGLRTAPAAPPLDLPVILFGFDRPDYLGRVCASLRAQRGVELDPRRVFLLQDGAVSPRSGVRYAEDAAIEASVATFREHFPAGQVAQSRGNLGIAANILRGEVLAFEAIGADCAYFFEDDLELGPDYLRIMGQLAALAAADPRIGYFAAYGDHVAAPPGPEAWLVPLQHHWAFGLRREPWRRLREWIAPYDAILEGADYVHRDHAAIFAWMAGQEVAINFSSQDAVKSVGCAALGIARLMTDMCFGRYIGAEGTSFRAETFRRMGYDRMCWVAGESCRLAEGAAAQVGPIIEDRRAGYSMYRRVKFDAFWDDFSTRKYPGTRMITREEAEALHTLLLDRAPDDPAASFDGVVGRETLRGYRARLLASEEFRGRNGGR